jgi:O-antigen ligase
MTGYRGMMVRTTAFRRWLVYGLMTASFAVSVLLKGGANASHWEWSALGVSIAAVLAIWPGPRWERTPREPFGFGIIVLLLGWMLFQITPLPPTLLRNIAPIRGHAVEAARIATGQDRGSWAALSAAPAASFGRVLDILPAMAAFVAAREMAWWWRDRISIAFAPVVLIAWMESLVGLLQFSFARENTDEPGGIDMPTGTYGYHNHFAGLLEIALPIAVMWAAWAWKKGTWQRQQGLRPAVEAGSLLGVATCLLLGIVASLSRMGFASTIAGACLTSFVVLASRHASPRTHRKTSRWLWYSPIFLLVIVGVLLILPPKQLVARFAELAAEQDLSQDSRAQMWADTTRMIASAPWSGVGVGAYEHGLYLFKTSMPLNTINFAHNDYLQFLAELGIVGTALVGALTLWVLAKVAAITVWLGASPNWEFAVGLLGTFLTLGFHSLADFNFYLPANALALAWLAGLAVSPGLKGR